MYAGTSTSIKGQGGWSNHWRCRRIDGGTADDASARCHRLIFKLSMVASETLLVGAVADCFILDDDLSWDLAKASRLSWLSLDCDVTGTLDWVDRVTRFTGFDMTARLVLWLSKTSYALRRLRLWMFSDSLVSWRPSSSRCSTRFGSCSDHGFRCTWKSSRSDTS